MRMVGPDGFDTGHGTPGCVLEVIERERLGWTSVLGPGYRPNQAGAGCESFPMTAVISFADPGGGKTQYQAVALHKDEKDRATHEKMGFHGGWGTTAGQLEELAKSLNVAAWAAKQMRRGLSTPAHPCPNQFKRTFSSGDSRRRCCCGRCLGG